MVALRGNITSVDAPQLDKELSPLVAKGSVVVDLAGVAIITSAALGVLLKCYRSLAEGNKLVLANPNADVAEVFEISGLGRVFRVFGDLEEAKNFAAGT